METQQLQLLVNAGCLGLMFLALLLSPIWLRMTFNWLDRRHVQELEARKIETALLAKTCRYPAHYDGLPEYHPVPQPDGAKP